MTADSSETASSPRFLPVSDDASERIAYQIRVHLAENALQPGDRIGTEAELAREFGVSRPTLREAVRLLAGSHLIHVSQGRAGGIFVANTANDGMGRDVSDAIATMLAADSVSLHQLLEARMFLEVPLAGLAAENATDETVRGLEAAIADAQGNHPASDEFRLADGRFHELLATAAGNELLMAFTRWILDVLQPSLVKRIGASIDGSAIIAQHGAILRAVKRRQPAAAQRAMRQHLEYLCATVRALEGEPR
ncbi:MAG TPA: FadR/GntR family transcriptional regulator [Solirubrobacteraceae bacterium]|nr:FadR/GntR family transcriptional regulator [Solirubrobacteraceae bacterium]